MEGAGGCRTEPPPRPHLTFQRQKMMSARRSSPPRMLPTRIQRDTGTLFPCRISSTISRTKEEPQGESGN